MTPAHAIRLIRATPRTIALLLAAGSVAVALAACSPGPAPTHPELPPGSRPSSTAPTASVPAMPAVTLTSPDFTAGGAIPKVSAGLAVEGGKDVSPALVWKGDPPPGTRSWALAMVDTTAPGAGYAHWLVLDIPAGIRSIPLHASGTDAMPSGSAELRNDSGSYGYLGPQPPAGTHTYVFVLYAMPLEKTGLGRGSSKQLFFGKVASALGATTLTGTFTR